MSSLFSPFTLGSVTLRNRIGMSPMCQYSAENGFASEWHIAHYGARAMGGAGLVIVEATAVEPRGRITPGDLGLWDDRHIEALTRVSRIIESQGAVPGIQIAHAGRKASCRSPWEGGHQLSDHEGGWRPVAPSKLAYGGKAPRIPHELSVDEIYEIEAAFVSAARRALDAGFKWLEIHAAHGYLLHSFCSPLSNTRTDNYGGTFKNRIRFLMETIRGVREIWPDEYPLSVRISATDWLKDGWNIDDSIALARRLQPKGVDLIDVSSGGLLPEEADVPVTKPGYQVSFAQRIRKEVEIPVATVGNITDAALATEIIDKEKADIVLLGRELLREPNWPIKTAKELGLKAPIPNQYLRAHN